jgi:hypothetical protein
MRKIFVIILFCFSSLFINENAICKSLCNASFKKIVKQPPGNSGVYMSSDDNGPKRFDGFFFKI